MIAYISISKAQANHYRVHLDDVDAGVAYATIAEALADHQDIPPEYAKFVNIEYHGVRLATLSVERMRGRSRELAAELLQLSAEVYEDE